VGVVLAATACHGQNAVQPKVCDVSRGTVLLQAVKLTEKVPSADFSVPARSTVWVRVDFLPTSAGGLFGTVGGVAELHSVAAGAAPLMQTAANGDVTPLDPPIVVHKAVKWERTALAAGDWQLYSLSDPTISLLSCPVG